MLDLQDIENKFHSITHTYYLPRILIDFTLLYIVYLSKNSSSVLPSFS